MLDSGIIAVELRLDLWPTAVNRCRQALRTGGSWSSPCFFVSFLFSSRMADSIWMRKPGPPGRGFSSFARRRPISCRVHPSHAASGRGACLLLLLAVRWTIIDPPFPLDCFSPQQQKWKRFDESTAALLAGKPLERVLFFLGGTLSHVAVQVRAR